MEEDVCAIIGIVFGCFFSVILIAMLVWWTWKCGYCDGKYLMDQSRISGTTSEALLVLRNSMLVFMLFKAWLGQLVW